MPELIPFPVDRGDVTPYYEALADALDGSGPALAPYAVGEPEPQLPDVADCDVPDALALVVSTSGSTGAPKLAMLTRDALRASAIATLDEIGGAGTWLLPLPPHHIAGTQVIVRSILCGTTPTVLDRWDLTAFVKATQLVARNAPPFSPIYTSLVPAQLRDILSDPDATRAAARYRAILVGGSATPASAVEAAREAGLRVRLTYGSSETAGGCVYDGVPLDGVGVRTLPAATGGQDDRNSSTPTLHAVETSEVLEAPESRPVHDRPEAPARIALTGPQLASGYLGDPARTREHFITLNDGTAAYLTDDLGTFTDHLRIVGRVDDLINTGGYKVAPRLVEDVALTTPGVADALVVATPHERFGEAVSLALVLDQEHRADARTVDETVAAVLEACRSQLAHYAVPTRVAVVEAFGLKGIGKPDRHGVATQTQWQNLA